MVFQKIVLDHMTRQLVGLLLCAAGAGAWLAPLTAPAAPARRTRHIAASATVEPVATNRAYASVYGTAVAADQAAYESDVFWAAVREATPGLDDSPYLARFRGFIHNLQVRVWALPW